MQLAALLRLLAVACVVNLAAVAEDGADAGAPACAPALHGIGC